MGKTEREGGKEETKVEGRGIRASECRKGRGKHKYYGFYINFNALNDL